MHEKSEEYRHLSEQERVLQKELEAMRNEKVGLSECFCGFVWLEIHISSQVNFYLNSNTI